MNSDLKPRAQCLVHGLLFGTFVAVTGCSSGSDEGGRDASKPLGDAGALPCITCDASSGPGGQSGQGGQNSGAGGQAGQGNGNGQGGQAGHGNGHGGQGGHGTGQGGQAGGGTGQGGQAGQNNGGTQSPSLGLACAPAGTLAIGMGTTLVCGAEGKWRYALRTDVPDGTYGAFTARPSWYPPLSMIMGKVEGLGCPPNGKLQLKVAPIAPEQVTTIIPYGAMISDHITPIDHAYINIPTLDLDPAARAAADHVPVKAPADGVVVEVSSLGSPTSMRVVIAHSCEAYSVFMVLNKLAGALEAHQTQVAGGAFVKPMTPVKAGDLIGLQRDNPLDYSLHDGNAWLSGFAHPYPYLSQDPFKPYTVDPLPHWPKPVADAYEAKMQRTDAPRIGKIDWDKDGSASGNWYREGTIGYSGQLIETFQNAGTRPVESGRPPAGKNGYPWSHLALAPHWVQPSVWLASMGTWSDPAGDFRQYAIKEGPPNPGAITAANGTVVYELATWIDTDAAGTPVGTSRPVGYKVKINSMVVGVLAVRVNANHTITVEKRPDLTSAAAFTGFTAKAETYWR